MRLIGNLESFAIFARAHSGRYPPHIFNTTRTGMGINGSPQRCLKHFMGNPFLQALLVALGPYITDRYNLWCIMYNPWRICELQLQQVFKRWKYCYRELTALKSSCCNIYYCHLLCVTNLEERYYWNYS